MCVFWIVGIIYLILRLFDIARDPKKYDTIKGYERYARSHYYWDPKKEFSRLDPPHGSRGVGLVGSLIILGLMLLPRAVCSDVYSEGKIIFTFSLASLIVTIAVCAVFFILMDFYVPMHFKSPACVCYNIHFVFKGKPRRVAWKRMTAYTLAAACICFPLYLLALNNYLIADEEKITYSEFFSLTENVIYFGEVKDVEVDYSDDGEPESYVFISGSGKTFPIYASDYPNGELERILDKIETLQSR